MSVIEGVAKSHINSNSLPLVLIVIESDWLVVHVCLVSLDIQAWFAV